MKPDYLERDVMTVEEAGRRLGLGRVASYCAAKRGEFPVLRFGRRIVVPKLAFERMLLEAAKPKEVSL